MPTERSPGTHRARIAVATPDLAREHRAGLIALLQATVREGAPLGFLHPVSESDAGDYWDRTLASLARGERLLILALEDRAVVGAVQLELADKQNARHRAEVQKLAVLPSHRGARIGKALMSAVEDEARRLNRTLLILDTREGGFAERFYERLGWQRSGRIPDFMRDERGRPHAAIIFHKQLVAVS